MSIKANELRLYNLFYPINRNASVHLPIEIPYQVVIIQPFKVEAVRADEIPAQIENWQVFDIHDISPIALNPSILEKAGFDSENGNFIMVADEADLVFTLRRDKLAPGSLFYCNVDRTRAVGTSIWVRKIAYLHELQNFYYALTGNELPIGFFK